MARLVSFFIYLFSDGVLLCCPGWNAVVWSRLTATSASSNSSVSASKVAGTTGACHHARQIFLTILVETGFHHIGQARFIYFYQFFSSEMKYCSVAQGGVQWCYLGSLQPPPLGFQQFSCFSLLSSWDYMHVPPCLVNFCILVEIGFYTMLARLVSNSWPQVVHPSWPPKVLGLQAGATVPTLILCYFLKRGFPTRKQASIYRGTGT